MNNWTFDRYVRFLIQKKSNGHAGVGAAERRYRVKTIELPDGSTPEIFFDITENWNAWKPSTPPATPPATPPPTPPATPPPPHSPPPPSSLPPGHAQEHAPADQRRRRSYRGAALQAAPPPGHLPPPQVGT